MSEDDRLERDIKKCWTIAKEDDEPFEEAQRPSWPEIVVNPEQDNKRMAKWRAEQRPDKKPYRDD